MISAYDQDVARKYATAFVNVYGDQLTNQDISRIQAAVDFLSTHQRALFFLQLPQLQDSLKIHELSALLIERYGLPAVFERLIRLLITDRRSNLFYDVLRSIDTVYQAQYHIMIITIKSPHELTSVQCQHLAQFIAQQTGNTVLYRNVIDPSLIAGIRIESNTTLWEYSIRKHLALLRSSITHA